MKTLPTSLKSKLARGHTTFATIWTILRTDGTVLRATDAQKNLIIGDYTYRCDLGLTRTDISESSGLEPSEYELTGRFKADGISERDLRAELYESAQVRMQLVDWADLSVQPINLMTGIVSETRLEADGKVTLVIQSLRILLALEVGESFSPNCRARFCDARCKLSLANFSWDGTIAALDPTNKRRIQVTLDEGAPGHSAAFFRNGQVTILDGDNAGFIEDIGDSDADGWCIMGGPAAFALAVGTRVTVARGCNKTREACISYGNILNFRGEPDVPGDATIHVSPDYTGGLDP